MKDSPVDKSDTTKWYSISGSSKGKVGFITSMSRYCAVLDMTVVLPLIIYGCHDSNFCGGCNRLRITADGKLKVCLFGEEQFSILNSLRGMHSKFSTNAVTDYMIFSWVQR